MGLLQRFLALVQVLHEVHDAAGVLEHLGARLGRGVADGVLPGFARSSCSTIFRPLFRNAISRKRLAKRVVVEDGGLGEDVPDRART